MAISISYNPNNQSCDYLKQDFWQFCALTETNPILNTDEKTFLEEKKLLEWRKNLKLIRECSQS